MIPLDLAARRVIVASILYYSADYSLLSDAEFDETCKRLCRSWDKLDHFRQWQLGSEDDLWASGYHIKATAASIGCAGLLLHAHDGRLFREGAPTGTHAGARWWPCSGLHAVETPSAIPRVKAGLLGSLDDLL